MRRVYFNLSALKIRRYGELFTSDRRWSGGLVRARGGDFRRGGCVLLFQALLLAHGGLTTLGANGMSMAVIGPQVIWCGKWPAAPTAPQCRRFSCAMLADLATYFVTSVQLGVAFPDPFMPSADRVCCEVYGDFSPHTDLLSLLPKVY